MGGQWSPERLIKQREKSIRLFHSHYERGSGCWEWKSWIGNKGYGQLRFLGVNWTAHRLSWTIANGPIPLGLCVLHRCDNRPCVRPDHLFLGTKGDNNRDKQRKHRGRSGPQAGEANFQARLTWAIVTEIRALYAKGWSKRDLGIRFGISREQASKIVRNRSWIVERNRPANGLH